jgi:hypothetical protein
LHEVPANWHFAVVCPLNTRTHSGHISGTGDASRRLPMPCDTTSLARHDHVDRRNPCKEARSVSELAIARPPRHREEVSLGVVLPAVSVQGPAEIGAGARTGGRGSCGRCPRPAKGAVKAAARAAARTTLSTSDPISPFSPRTRARSWG